LEPQFFAALLKGLSLTPADLPGAREDPSTWPALGELFTKVFKTKTRDQWEEIFDGTDACATPVLTQAELEQKGFDQRPIVTLRHTPGLAISHGSAEEKDVAVRAAKGQGSGISGQGWDSDGLSPGVGGEEILQQWLGWSRGKQFDVNRGGLELKDSAKL
jgi:alpha-methylacyl-CoA racemase